MSASFPVVIVLAVFCCCLMAALLEDNPKVQFENLQSCRQNIEVLASKTIVGKIRANKILYVKASSDTIANAWSNYQGLKITELGKNCWNKNLFLGLSDTN